MGKIEAKRRLTLMDKATYLCFVLDIIRRRDGWAAPFEVVLPDVWHFAMRRIDRCRRKRHKPEEIVAKLRQVDVWVLQAKPVAEAVRSIAVTEVT